MEAEGHQRGRWDMLGRYYYSLGSYDPVPHVNPIAHNSTKRTVQIPKFRLLSPISVVSSAVSSPASDLLSLLHIATTPPPPSLSLCARQIQKPPPFSSSQGTSSPLASPLHLGFSNLTLDLTSVVRSAMDLSGSRPWRTRLPAPAAAVEDRFLPIANISRIMKKALPANAKIAKDAKETVQECVSEFISFITSEASDKCQREKRKTINGDDLLWAMATLGFEDYIEPLKLYLQKYREGDSKVSAKGGENSVKQDTASSHGGSQPGSISQGVNFENLEMQKLEASSNS
ncbi:nuclear transcription factor Y subunit B-3-like [Canna indica]|uniref:Nuclear transcription factor Y subunit B-3-like n=1 Tax=Canna indica TaxID=4628 RepID=A0AAQ3JUZ6_9LILI|nr:nuclear transcription factor Y subunit B-3-like [Canna indica]